MPITRAIDNANRLIDWTPEINEVENQYGVINGLGLFSESGTSQTAIIFDKLQHEITLLPQVNRGAGSSTYGKDRDVETFALALPYFKHSEFLTNEDVQGWRQPGMPHSEEALASARAKKIEDMRLAADQTREYMLINAIKGVTKSPDGKTVANMFTEFGVVQKSIDFDLGTSGTDVDSKIAELKRYIQKNAKTGGAITGLDVMVDSSFFDKLISHPNIRESYIYYQNAGRQNLRDDLSRYFAWGVSDVFEHRGVRFWTYDATFNLPNGTTENALETDTGFSIVRGVRDLYRGFNGPSAKLSGANVVGRPMFLHSYADPKDEFEEFQLEMAPLFFMSKPLLSVKVTSST